jgi:S-adenosylmethionine:tRNA ribosyltransferase-isomerase
MKVSEFYFELPRERIAARPASPRDGARLLEVEASGMADRLVSELPACLQPGDLLVVNDTKVIPARLTGRRGAAGIEATLHKRIDGRSWDAFARPAKKLREGDVVTFGAQLHGGALSATVVAKGEGGEVRLAFDRKGAPLDAALDAVGVVPLPPYIPRERGPDVRDRKDFQTIFADKRGAVAAPTAGLHFTDRLLGALDARGIARVAVTLHVGAGTFLPVKTEDTLDHRMHAEWGRLDEPAAAAIEETRAAGGRIVAVGTTSLRLIEAAADEQGSVRPFEGEIDLFITPGYRFKAVDVLLTNFHLPCSTLFMLVCAFAGTELMKAAYDHAIGAGYRFYSYGDATLLHRQAT